MVDAQLRCRAWIRVTRRTIGAKLPELDPSRHHIELTAFQAAFLKGNRSGSGGLPPQLVRLPFRRLFSASARRSGSVGSYPIWADRIFTSLASTLVRAQY